MKAEDYALLLQHANLERRVGKYVRALAKYDAVAKAMPKDSAAMSGRADCLYNLGHREEALEAVMTSLANNPGSVLSHIVLARLLDDDARPEESRSHVDRAVALAPENGEPYACRGILARRHGELREAMQDLRRAISLDPRLYLAHYYLTACLQASGDVQGVYHQSKRLMHLHPSAENFVGMLAALLAAKRLVFMAILLIPFLYIPLHWPPLLAGDVFLLILYMASAFVASRRGQASLVKKNVGWAAVIAFGAAVILYNAK